jgi:DNA-binding SARP family transcriptional activator
LSSIHPKGEAVPPETASSLTRRLSAVVSKRSGVALGVWGEPGVGKTFSVQAALREIPCRSASLHATVSSLALVRALPRPKNLPDWAERQVASLERGGHVEQKAIADVLVAWLAALAPFVLFVEDLHEAGSDRVALWTNLAVAVNRTRGVGLIVTSRTAPPEPFVAHHLEPLNDQDARALLESEAGSPLPSEATAWIGAHARGNPLFALEYFRHLTRLGHLWSDGRRWRWREPEGQSMPTSVEAVIGHHLQAVGHSGTTHRALVVKAMLPFDADDALWMEVAGLKADALRAAKDGLERGGILHAGAFVHPLYREATRAALGDVERCEIARRAVEMLAERDPVAAAAFVSDADLSADQTRALLERAARVARELGDHSLAAGLLVRVAGLHENPARVSTLLEAARLSREVNLSDALEIAQAALKVDADDLEAVLLTAELLAGLGRGEEAQRLLERPLSRYGQGVSPDAVRVFETRVRVKHLSHDYAGVLELWHEFTVRHPGKRLKIGMSVIARAYVQLWRLEEAGAVIAQALDAPKISRLELAELQYIRSIIPNYAGDYARAEVGFSAFLKTLETLIDGSPRFRELRAGTLQLRAYMRNVLGRPREAALDITEALLLSASFGNAGYYAHVQSELGLYLLESGEYRRAEDVIHEARATLERVGNAIYLSVLERIAARLYIEWAPPHGTALCLKYARAALEYVERADRPPFYTAGALFMAAWAEALHGRSQDALTLAAELDASASALGQMGVTAGAAWVRGLALERLGQPDEARRAFEVALAAAVPMRLGPTLDRMGLELDRLTGDLESARARTEVFRAHGALGPVHVAERYFPQLDASAAPQRLTTANETTASVLVRLEVLGPTQVMVGGSALSDRTRKGKELLAALCEARIAGRREVSDLELFDALYPDLPEDKAGSALKQLVYRLRSTLGSNAILRSNDGYALGAVESDAERFLETHDTQLWRGPYLSDLGENWVSSARDALHYALRKQALELLESDPTETARLGRILLEADPFDLEALSLTLRALQVNGDHPSATRLRAWAQAQFEEVGEVLPSEFEGNLVIHRP